MQSKPIVLLGDTSSKKILAKMRELEWGVMIVARPPSVKIHSGMPWAFDNGVFSCWRNGTQWDKDKWVKLLDKVTPFALNNTPLFAVVPDIVGKGNESLEWSVNHAHYIQRPFPRALALQDGMTYQEVIRVINRFDYLFIGGTNAYKLHCADIVRLGHDYGKRVHYARASTPEKLEYAIHCGVDSLDTTFPLWTKERFELYKETYLHGHPNHVLFQR